MLSSDGPYTRELAEVGLTEDQLVTAFIEAAPLSRQPIIEALRHKGGEKAVVRAVREAIQERDLTQPWFQN